MPLMNSKQEAWVHICDGPTSSSRSRWRMVRFSACFSSRGIELAVIAAAAFDATSVGARGACCCAESGLACSRTALNPKP